ncbi:neuromedin-U receptor 1-like [Physella acuta]|uniref:neuromedin-U receptor 1-like n=1 Tax=Physella acuta TaxID=109671 RepID=UPI0027DC53CD|nr:neuromedin-U receptor 1-like [Physella acuta]
MELKDYHVTERSDETTGFPAGRVLKPANSSEDVVIETVVGSLISDEEKQIYEIITLVVISSAIGLFGIASNIINIIIFYKQGLNNTVNIGFTGLAISDLCSLITIEWYCISFNPLFYNADIIFFAPELQHLYAGCPHGCFARITAWVTVYLTAERCLCIVSPLKVKQILTPKRTIIILSVIYFVVMLPLIPEYVTAYGGYKFYPFLNKTLIGLVFTSDRYKVDGLSFLLYAILMFVSFLAVIILTAVLVIKLKQKTEWRKKSTFDSAQSDNISKRDKSTIKMVIVVAVILIVNFSPTVAFFTGVFIVPGFSITGKYRNLFLVAAAFTFIFDTLNSSVNIISYYTMSSKFRQTFHETFSFGREFTRKNSENGK